MKMKPAISITTTILVSVLAVGLASAQSPSATHTPRTTLGVHPSAPASATHAPAKPSGTAVVAPAKASSSSPQAGARPASAKRRDHARRGGAVLVGQSAEPAPAAAPQDEAAVAASNGASGSGPGEAAVSEEQVKPTSRNSANGRRDPFVSPVVSRAGGSGCSTGKKCLEIGAINLRGVVHAESGFIAVVSNSMNKAYFLRENDPVFNGYVVKITGDSIVFQETVQDRLGKTFTREVVKKITTPAV
jgi:hypothetical protein